MSWRYWMLLVFATAGCLSTAPYTDPSNTPAPYSDSFELNGFLLEKATPCATSQLCVNPGIDGDENTLEVTLERSISAILIELRWNASSPATATLAYRACEVDGDRCAVITRKSGVSPLADRLDIDAPRGDVLRFIVHARDDETTGTVDLRQEFHMRVTVLGPAP